MLDRVKDVLSKFTEKEIEESSVLGMDLDLSSFDLAEIVCAFEDEFNIEISDRQAQQFVTVEDIVTYLETHPSLGDV